MVLLTQELEWGQDNMEENKRVFKQDDFEFVQMNEKIFDKKFETKAVGYFGDAFKRFCKNKSSLVAFIILLLIVLMAIVMPMISPYKNLSTTETKDQALLPPRIPGLEKLGIFDGTQKKTANLDKIISLNDPRVIEMEESELQNYYFIEFITGYDSIESLERASYTTTFKDETIQKVDFKYNLYQALNKPRWERSKTYQEYLAYQASGVIMKDTLVDENGEVVRDENGNPVLQERVEVNTDAGKNILIKFCQKNGIKRFPWTDEDGIKYSSLDDPAFTEYYNRKTGDKLENYYNYKILIDPTKDVNFKEVYHYFGTDNVGRDLWTRLWKGTRLSLLIGLFVAIVSITVGVIWGSVSGYYGGTVDIVMERFTEILTGIPWIVIMTITKMLLVGHISNILIVAISLILTSWTGTAGMVRSQMYRYKNREYVLASRTLGAKDPRLIFKHILPNALGTIVTSCVLVIPSAIFFESSVAYLGLGVDASTVSIGNLLNAGQTLGIVQYPYLTLFPAILISILMISFNMFGNGLRDALNPSLRGSE